MSSGSTLRPLCSEVEQKLSAFIDGELPELERLGIERHLESCADCRRELELLTEALRVIREEGRSVPAPPAWESVRATVAASTVQRSTWGRWLWDKRTIAASIGLVAVAGIVFALVRGEWSPKTDLTADGVESAQLQLAELPGLESFLAAHRAREVDRAGLEGSLHFAAQVPEELPGGFRLERAFLVRDRCCAGSCLVYRKGKELVSLVQHPPSHPVSWNGGELESCTIAGRSCRRSQSGGIEVLQIEPEGRNLTVVARAGAIDPAVLVRALVAQ
ncbi:MAG: anti-sigma factor family protein [Thermoanaerobaculia bacterium]